MRRFAGSGACAARVDKLTMANSTTADQLRAMAEHRGLKLLRSRKRKPGVGDFGKFGLTDAQGGALLGISKAGLTATAQEVEDYLRGRALGTWKLSAETTLPAQKRKRKNPIEPRDEPSPVRRRDKPPTRAGSTGTKTRQRAETSPNTPRPPHKPTLRIVANEDAEAVSVPRWHIRPATVADAAALAGLLRQLAGARAARDDIAAHIASLKRTKSRLVVADCEGVIGCCAWTIVPTVHRGLLGRITLLLVDKKHRRSGIATAMMEFALNALGRTGCGAVEAMSDIMIDNAHNFFRQRGYDQISYRFVRALALELPGPVSR